MKIMEIFQPNQNTQPTKSLELDAEEARMLGSAMSAYGLNPGTDDLSAVMDLQDKITEFNKQFPEKQYDTHNDYDDDRR